MLLTIQRDTRGEHRRLLVAGVVFLTVIGLLIGLSIAVYQKVFEPATTITIEAERAGLQLPVGGDVRLHGALVGRVRSVDSDGEQARIEVALEPEAARAVPADVRVAVLPTTLFGQKFIDLRPPRRTGAGSAPDPGPITDGAVVPASRVRTNVELQQVLADLFPVLRAVRPADLNATLHALASALEGRGERLGELMVATEGYLGRFNQRLPLLQEDLRLLASVADTYTATTPDLARLLRDGTVLSRTLVDQETELAGFLGDVTGASEVTRRVLAENERGLIRFADLSRPALRLLEVYAPEYPCLLRGLDRYTDRLSEIFANGRVNQILELGSVQKEAYDESDRPVYGEVGHGPWCATLPDPDGVVTTPLADGSDADEPGAGTTLPSLGSLGIPLEGRSGRGFANPTSGYAGTPAEQRLVNALLATESGRDAAAYGSMGSLLYGPQLRGSTWTPDGGA